jgi:hypothetical protein
MVRISGWVLFFALSSLFTPATLPASYYFGFEDIGGHWYDAEKSANNSEDDQLCWAATTSNMLAYTGWGFPTNTGFTDADDIFSYFQQHWSDEGGNMYYGTQWWFDGIDHSQQGRSWSRVDHPGGGFYSSDYFDKYYSWNSDDATLMKTADDFLHAGDGVGLSLTKGKDGGGHAISLWGYEFSETKNDYAGIYVTDSDDGKHLDSASDNPVYYEVEFQNTAWYLQDFYGSSEWHITEVHGLAQMPSAAVPIPSTCLLLGTGVLCLRRRKSKFQQKPF